VRLDPAALRRWKRDPVAFILEVLRDENGRPFRLYPEQQRFLREALTLTSDERLPYPELLFSAIKKSGKTTLAAMIAIYLVIVIAGPWAECYVVSNDLEQSIGRVWESARRIVKASLLLRGSARITASRIEFRSTGSFIQAVASDYAGLAGINPSLVVLDELWAFFSERANRLFDETVPSPTRNVSARLTVTTAGFAGESGLLERLYHRGLQGREIAPALYAQPGYLMLWSHEPLASWQTPEWLEQMQQQLRPNAYRRLYRNEFVAAESSFVSMEDWDACMNQELRPVMHAPGLPVWIGLDASVRHDQTAIVAVTYDENQNKVRLVNHRVFRPSPDAPLDFEATVIATLEEWRRHYQVRRILADPYQLESIIQGLQKRGLPIEAFNQTLPNLTEAASNLFQLVRSRTLQVYSDDDMRRSVLQTVASESARGWKLAKEKQSQKIDVVIALSMAALGAVRRIGYAPVRVFTFGSSPWEALVEAFGSAPSREADLPEWDVGFTDKFGNPLRSK
jgi:phage terminase large subunit-like protein